MLRCVSSESRRPWKSTSTLRPPAGFAAEGLARTAADRRGSVLILGQSKVSDRHRVLVLALRHGECAVPIAWRVETTEGAIGFDTQSPCSTRSRPGCGQAPRSA